MKQASVNTENILKRITDAVIALDQEWTFIYANTAAELFFGKPAHYLLGKNLWLEFSNETGGEFYKACIEAMESQRMISIETYDQEKDRWLQNNMYPSTDGLTIMFCDITDNKQATLRELQKRIESEHKLLVEKDLSDKIINSLPGIFYMSDRTPKLLLWNKAFEIISGYTAQELGSMVPINLFEPEDHMHFMASMEKAYREGFADTEARLISKDGKVTPFYFTGVRIEYKGKPAMLGVGIDITERITAERAIKESEEKYRTLVEQASDGIYIADANGRIVTVNSSGCRLSGYSEAEIIGKTIDEFVPKDELLINPLRFDELKQGKTVLSERKIKLKSGEILQIESITKMLSDGRILSFVRDITERTKARDEIIKEKNLSDSIINSLPGIFYLYDEGGNFLRWNKNFEFVSGYIDTEIMKMKPLDFFDAGERDLLKQKGEEVFTRGMADVEAHFLTKDKRKIPYYFNGWRVMFEGKPCLIGVGIDISEKRKSEELLIKSHEDVRRLASHLTQVREEERRRIGREIHDELGQQLTAIKMDVAWIDKKTPGDTGLIKNKLKNIISLLDGSNESVRRILTELSPGIIDNHGLPEGLESLNRQFAAATGISVEFTTNESTINLVPEISNCIFRVYQESLTNIMRYAQADKVVTSINITKDTVDVTIKDNGKGFDTTAIQTKKSFGILGMKERVLSQNGKFELQSKMGRGTKIMVTVPYRTE